MKFIFKASGGQITLPITPESFQVETAINIQKVNIHEAGDVNLPGNMALGVIKIDCIFPNRDYPFATDYGDPYGFVDKFQKLIKKKKAVRFIVTDTEVNERVLVESISYGERDGTGDVYATITMAGYREVGAVRMAQVLSAATPTASASTARPVEKAAASVQQYHVKDSDSYMSICRAFYKSYYTAANSYAMGQKLADYNGDSGHVVPSKYVLREGNREERVNRVIKIPPYETLGMK